MAASNEGRTRLVFEVVMDVPEENDPISVDALAVEEALRNEFDRVVYDPVQDINVQQLPEGQRATEQPF